MDRDNLDKYWDALCDVKDPEIPTVSIVEMGMVHEIYSTNDGLVVEVMPTFVGCPALDMIKNEVEKRLLREDIEKVFIHFIYHPNWTSNRISAEGLRKLKEFGIASPHSHSPPCPYCEADGTEIHNLFGPTPCRAIFYCKRCKQPFEGMKVV